VFIIMLLIYTATYVPYKICFEDETSDAHFVFDLLVDFFFLIDIILTFFTAYQDNYGSIVTRKSLIAKNYIRGFFVIDVLTTFPF
jgi:hypothetical protein